MWNVHGDARRRRWIGALLAIAPLCACGYLDRRFTDLHDCFVYRWHDDGFGAGADVKVGPLQVAVGGWYAETGIGKDCWWQEPGFTLTNHGYGVPITTIGPIAYGQSWTRVLATSSGGNHPQDPHQFDDVTSWVLLSDVFDLDGQRPFRWSPTQRLIDLFGVEVGVAPLFWQAHLGFNVAEFADFVLGFVGLDLFGDDGVPRPPTLPYLPRQSRG